MYQPCTALGVILATRFINARPVEREQEEEEGKRTAESRSGRGKDTRSRVIFDRYY